MELNSYTMFLKMEEYREDMRATVQEACAHFMISRSAYYRIAAKSKKYDAGDRSAFRKKSCRPKKLARQTPPHICDEAIRLMKTQRFDSANAICRHMRSSGLKITTSTVIRILEDEGLYDYKTIIDRNGNKKKVRGFV